MIMSAPAAGDTGAAGAGGDHEAEQQLAVTLPSIGGSSQR